MADGSKSRPAVEGVASADRALTVLSAFRKGDRALSLAELATRTGATPGAPFSGTQIDPRPVLQDHGVPY